MGMGCSTQWRHILTGLSISPAQPFTVKVQMSFCWMVMSSESVLKSFGRWIKPARFCIRSGIWMIERVAQVSNLLYRRFLIGRRQGGYARRHCAADNDVMDYPNRFWHIIAMLARSITRCFLFSAL